MFRSSKQISDHETRLATLSLAVAELRQSVGRSANQELFTLIKTLSDDIEQLRVSVRSLHGKVAIQKRLEPGNGRGASTIPDDEEFQAIMELQNAGTKQ